MSRRTRGAGPGVPGDGHFPCWHGPMVAVSSGPICRYLGTVRSRLWATGWRSSGVGTGGNRDVSHS